MSIQSPEQAKEFLVSEIVRQAEREGVPLTEIERKMLYFSETHGSLPDIADVAAAFDAEYDQDEYEKKLGRIIGLARNRAKDEGGEKARDWEESIRLLGKEDHYLLVLLDCA